jgi:hypothetical protein
MNTGFFPEEFPQNTARDVTLIINSIKIIIKN